MMIPLYTDAPLYHFPFSTIGLMTVNVLCFGFTGCGNYVLNEDWLLSFGEGLHPLEWYTSAFFHFGWFHLIGNMLFLWAFGIVVEGKVGWWRFLCLYLGIVTLHGFVEQLIMLNHASKGGSAGASGAIYGLIAMSMVWAPVNEVRVMLFGFVRVFFVDITIHNFAALYIVLEIIVAGLNNFHMSSEVIHLIGIVVGFPLAAWMVRAGKVDCENWDLFAVMAGTYGDQDRYLEIGNRNHNYAVATGLSAATESAEDLDNLEVRHDRMLQSIESMLRAGKAMPGHRLMLELQKDFPDAKLPRPMLAKLIKLLYKAQAWSRVGPLLEEFVQRFPDDCDPMKLRLGRLLIHLQNRPRAAQRMLEEIKPAGLDEKMRAAHKKLTAEAAEMIDDGVVEMQDHSWG